MEKDRYLLIGNCSLCHQDVYLLLEGTEYDSGTKWHHDRQISDGYNPEFRNGCQIMHQHYHIEYCSKCGDWYPESWGRDEFVRWDHCVNLHWAEIDVKGDR